MKGPFERLKYDLRRIWECPRCGHKVRTDGTATTQFCRCGKNNTNPPVSMRLVGDGARRLVPPVPRPALEPAVVTAAAEVNLLQVDVIAVATPQAAEAATTQTVADKSVPPANPSSAPGPAEPQS